MEYSKMNAQSHRAFIRHNGAHKTKKAGQGDWNKDLLHPVKDGIDRAFATLDDEGCGTLKAQIVQVVIEILFDLNQKLKSKRIYSYSYHAPGR